MILFVVLADDIISKTASLHRYMLFTRNNIEVAYNPYGEAMILFKNGDRLSGFEAWRYITALNGLELAESKQLLVVFPWDELYAQMIESTEAVLILNGL